MTSNCIKMCDTIALHYNYDEWINFYSIVNKHFNSTKHISTGRFHLNSIPYARLYLCSMTEQTRLNHAKIPDSWVLSGSSEVQNHAHRYHEVQWCRNIWRQRHLSPSRLIHRPPNLNRWNINSNNNYRKYKYQPNVHRSRGLLNLTKLR